MRVVFLVCCTVCCTWRACLRGIAIRARSSRTIKIIQWSGRRRPFDEHDSLPVRGRQVLDVRVAELAEIAPWLSLSVQANWRFVRISATSRSVVNMLAGVSYTKEAPIQLLGKIKIETNAAFEAYDLCPRSAQSLACPRPSPDAAPVTRATRPRRRNRQSENSRLFSTMPLGPRSGSRGVAA
jgi:hypothetical protein